MNKLKLDKNDVKFLLSATAVIPILSFVCGFYVASSLNKVPQMSKQLVSMPLESESLDASISRQKISETSTIQKDRPVYEESVNKTVFADEKLSLTSAEPNRLSQVIESNYREPKLKKDTQAISFASAERHFIVQAGLFTERQNANKLLLNLHQKELKARIIEGIQQGFPTYRIIIGSFDSMENALHYSEFIQNNHNLRLYVTTIGEQRNSELIVSL